MRVSLVILLVFVTACGPSEIVVKGKVFASHDASEPLPQAQVSIRDEDGGKYDNVRANANGKFEALAPEGEYINAEITGDGFELTSFTGLSGVADVFRVEDGMLYGFSSDERADWEERFAGCPDMGSGGMVVGEIRMLELSNGGEHPLVANGVAEVVTRNVKKTWKACYLDDEGLAYDPDATNTGASGAFAVFGIEPGNHILTVGYEFAPDAWSYSDTYVRAVEDGVAPRFPAWVEWPDL